MNYNPADEPLRFYNSKAWERLSAAVRKADHYQCVLCGSAKRPLIVHHVKHLKDRPDLALSLRDPDTGERQLISFARAIAHDPKILVLDEATANIDSATEAVIQKSIQQISEGRTAVFIAHRLSTIRNADCIYYLEGGVVAEKGSHEELMDRKGKYYALVREQE